MKTIIRWFFSIATVFFFATSGLASANDILLRWHANIESDVQEYNVYYGIQSRSYGPPIPVGKTTEYLLTDLEPGKTYFFAITAVDNADNESAYSSESSVAIPANDNQAPSIAITTPSTNATFSTASSTVSLGGTAADDQKLQTVTWSASDGQSGTASGTTNWSAGAIQLQDGNTTFTVTATDAADNQATDKLTVTKLADAYFPGFGDTAGVDPAGWVDTGAQNSLETDDSLFKTYDVDGEIVFGTKSTATNIHSHYTDVDYDAAAGIVLTGRMRMSNTGGGIGVTFLSDYNNSDTYYRLRRYSGKDFHLSPHGTAALSGDTASDVVPVANSWYLYKVEVVDSDSRTEIRAKVWAEGSSEPADWQIDAWDDSASRLTNGRIGVWSMGAGSKYWDDLAIYELTSQPSTP